MLGLGVSGRSAARTSARSAGPAWWQRTSARTRDLGPRRAVGAGIELAHRRRTCPTPATSMWSCRARAFRASATARARAPGLGRRRARLSRALAVPIAAVTGTNGKSTTTCLHRGDAAGGGTCAPAQPETSATPALSLVGAALDAAVLEVSSFQLESVEMPSGPRWRWCSTSPPTTWTATADLRTLCQSRERRASSSTRVPTMCRRPELRRSRWSAIWRRRAARRASSELHRTGCTREGGPSATNTTGAWLDGATPWCHSPTANDAAGGSRSTGCAFVGRPQPRERGHGSSGAVVGARGRSRSAPSAPWLPSPACPTAARSSSDIAGVTCFVNDSKATNVGAAVRALDRTREPGDLDRGADATRASTSACSRSPRPGGCELPC